MWIARPPDLAGVLETLAEHPEATLLAGGTDLMVEVNLEHRRPAGVICLRQVDELTAWEPDFIGAGVTWDRLEQGPIPALAELARTVGSPQIRAAGTLGGNLGTASPAGDALPWLAAVDARVELASSDGRRTLAWHEFLLGPKRTARRADEVILGVHLPDGQAADLAACPQAFAKVGVRQAMVIAIVNCCVVHPAHARPRVALGAVAPTVVRVPAAEALLDDTRPPSSAELERFEQQVREEVAPITDHRATAAYRRHAAGVLARRTLERCVVR
jgi:CO/xanthine dehydrogenase FAD-binding subunit